MITTYLKKIIDLIFYSNLWIALCATAMALQTQFILTKTLSCIPLIGVVFFSTLFLYAIHRIVGLSKVKDFLDMERYAVISSFKSHITIYAILAGIGGLYCFVYISLSLKLLLFVPALISLAYVLPIFGNNRRLRDFDQIKIYLIALVWAWITVVMVGLDTLGDEIPYTILVVWFIERACFIFAITLPFDIRDLEVDKKNGVATIPARLGAKKSIQLAYWLLLICGILSSVLWYLGVFGLGVLIGSWMAYFLTAIAISYSDKIKHDYFFTGLIDGTMLLLFGCVWLGDWFVG